MSLASQTAGTDVVDCTNGRCPPRAEPVLLLLLMLRRSDWPDAESDDDDELILLDDDTRDNTGNEFASERADDPLSCCIMLWMDRVCWNGIGETGAE